MRAQIEHSILSGGSTRRVGKEFGFSKDAISRHERICMPRSTSAAGPVDGKHESSESERVLRGLFQRVSRLLRRSEKEGDLRSAAAFAGQLDSLAERIQRAGIKPRKTPNLENTRLRVVFTNPLGAKDDPASSLGEIIDFAARNEGETFEKLLEALLLKVVQNPRLTEAQKSAVVDFLQAWENAAPAENRSADVTGTQSMAIQKGERQ
jgi:hypothetical protein